MKRKISLILLMFLMIGIVNVNAATFTDYFPLGKNYLDENNLEVTSNSVSTITNFVVKDSTVYTLSIPGADRIDGNLSVFIEGNEIYLDTLVAGSPNCVMELQATWCTFETGAGETDISIVITSSDILGYYNSYGLYGFQLEEGGSPTSYEEYIAPFVDTSLPEFSGAGAYIKSYTTDERIEDIVSEHVVVYDDVDGNLSGNVQIDSDLYTGNEQVVGEYLVVLSASDTSGNTAYFNLTIIVKDEIVPIITGPDTVEISISEVTNVNKIITDNFVISDDYSTTSMNVLIDNYTVNKDVLGTYTITFEGVDESLNSVSKEFSVTLVDVDSPIIESSLTINSYLSSPLNIDDVLNTLVVTDNYDDLSSVTANIVSNAFTGNENIPGTYIVGFEVSDNSGNTTSNSFVINVIDDVEPIITGPINYSGSYEEGLVVNDFINMLSVSDNIDSLLLSDISVIGDTYSSRTGLVGDYVITFSISDSNGNNTIHVLNINLFDDVAPLIYIDNYIVTVDIAATFTPNDALILLFNSNELIEGNYSIKTLFNEYTGNELREGTYIYLLEFTNDFGETYEKEFLVKVVDENKTEINDDLILRNAIMYSASIGFFGFVVYKNKK